jgi:dihydroxy-acid dehydratase
MLVPDAEIAARRTALEKQGGYHFPASQTPWQAIHRGMVEQLSDGMVLTPAVKYRRVAQKSIPRDNH